MTSHFSDRVQLFLNGGIAFCLGLVPVVHLPTLRVATALILLSVLLRGKSIFKDVPTRFWPYFLLLQFALYFTFNAMVYPSMEGNMRHFQRVALESWSITLLGLLLVWVFVSKNRDFMVHYQRWTPFALLGSFLIMSYFFFGPQGSRARALSTNALLPPIWFLTLTLICFCSFFGMSKAAQIFRGALMLLAAFMALYSGGRMILAIWFICAASLGSYLCFIRPNSQRPVRDLGYLLFAMVALVVLLYAVDAAMGGTLDMRVRYTINHLRSDGLSSDAFFRLELWAAANEVIATYWPMGAGQVNESFLIHNIIDRGWWYRAHQTYLSYLIAGGLVALLSGLLFRKRGLDPTYRFVC